jgi:hypothetical protein
MGLASFAEISPAGAIRTVPAKMAAAKERTKRIGTDPRPKSWFLVALFDAGRLLVLARPSAREGFKAPKPAAGCGEAAVSFSRVNEV